MSYLFQPRRFYDSTSWLSPLLALVARGVLAFGPARVGPLGGFATAELSGVPEHAGAVSRTGQRPRRPPVEPAEGSSSAASGARGFPAWLGREVTFGRRFWFLPCWWQCCTRLLVAGTAAEVPPRLRGGRCHQPDAWAGGFIPLLPELCWRMYLPACSPSCTLDLGSPLPGPARPRGSRGSFRKPFTPTAAPRGSAVAENVLFVTEMDPVLARAPLLGRAVSLRFGPPETVRRALPGGKGHSQGRARHRWAEHGP